TSAVRMSRQARNFICTVNTYSITIIILSDFFANITSTRLCVPFTELIAIISKRLELSFNKKYILKRC
ncbi:hypothetical protein, partial [Ligilactobacillus ruminis]|uniref:hypothetical protein n=1 Tax=Ligilactobacillus ruminis TaxID=1623 RepID=UPI00325B4032